MDAPKPATVVLLLAVFACVALYVLGVGLGAQDESEPGQSTMSKQELRELRDRFFDPRSVTSDELRAVEGCTLSGREVRVVRGRECVVDVAEADARLRMVEVEPRGGEVDLRLEVKGRTPVSIPVEGLEEAQELPVLGAGATLRLECAGGCPVRVRLR